VRVSDASRRQWLGARKSTSSFKPHSSDAMLHSTAVRTWDESASVSFSSMSSGSGPVKGPDTLPRAFFTSHSCRWGWSRNGDTVAVQAEAGSSAAAWTGHILAAWLAWQCVLSI